MESSADNRIDVIATDHAPHTAKEKQQSYFNCPSGAPMVQHALTVMLQHHLNNKLSVEKIVENVSCTAICFNIEKEVSLEKVIMPIWLQLKESPGKLKKIIYVYVWLVAT